MFEYKAHKKEFGGKNATMSRSQITRRFLEDLERSYTNTKWDLDSYLGLTASLSYADLPSLSYDILHMISAIEAADKVEHISEHRNTECHCYVGRARYKVIEIDLFEFREVVQGGVVPAEEGLVLSQFT